MPQAFKSTKEIDAEVGKLRDDVSIRQVATCRELRTNHFAYLLKAQPQDGDITNDRELNIPLSIDQIRGAGISGSYIRRIQGDTTNNGGRGNSLSHLTGIEGDRQLRVTYARHEDTELIALLHNDASVMLDTIGLGDLNILQVIRLLGRITRGERTEREDTEGKCPGMRESLDHYHRGILLRISYQI